MTPQNLDEMVRSSRFKFDEAPFPPTVHETELFINTLLGVGGVGTDAKVNLLRRLFERTEFRDCGHDSLCWCWLGPTSGKAGRGKDYGRVSYDGQTHAVHRLAFATVFGPVGPKKQIDHACRVRACWNPWHLQKVTHLRNQILRDRK